MSDARPRPLAASETRQEDWWDEVRAVFIKDLRSELRTKAALAGILVFAFTAMTLLGFLVQPVGLGLTQYEAQGEELRQRLAEGLSKYATGQSPQRADILSSLFWVVCYFSAMVGVPRVFVKEQELGTAAAMRLYARPSAVYAGKLAYNTVLLSIVGTVLILPFLTFFQPWVRDWPMFLLHVLFGSIGLAGAGSILGAIAAKAQNRGFLSVVLGFGPLLPILVLSVNGMTASLQGVGENNLLLLVSYVVVMVAVAGMLFEKVWEA